LRMAKKILVVDDNEKNRKLLCIILKKSGYEVHEAVNGDEAIRFSRELVPDLIFLDYRMPVVNGIAASRAIKAHATTSHIPILMVTASAMEGDREMIISQSGCDEFHTKPIDQEEILAAVRRRLGERP